MRHPLDWLLRLAVPKDDRPAVLGDLSEEYERRVRRERSRVGAHVWYVGQLCAAVGFAFLGRVRQLSWTTATFRLESVWQDLRYAVRGLLKSRGFTVVAVLTLALGIGANAAIFSAVNGILIEHLPYTDASRLLTIRREQAAYNISPAEARVILQECPAIERVAIYEGSSSIIVGDSMHLRRETSVVSSDFFRMLGVEPLLGRYFRPEDTQPGAKPVAVLSYRLWMDGFGGDLQIVGRDIGVDNDHYIVIGVMPRAFELGVDWLGDGEEGLWLPLADTPSATHRPGGFLIARVKAAVPLSEARVQLRTISPQLAARFSSRAEGVQLQADAPSLFIDRNLRTGLLVLLGAVVFVLLETCVNIGALLVARAWTRQRELAIRKALGAGTMRIVRQLLTESVLLSLAGGALGVLLAFVGVALLRAIAPPGTPRLDRLEIDRYVLEFTVGISLLSAIVFGLLPALQASLRRVSGPLQPGLAATFVTVATGRHSLRAGLLIAEVALAVMLVIGGGLMALSFHNLMQVDIGLRTDHVITMQVNLRDVSCDPNHPTTCEQSTASILEGVSALPGVERAAVSTGGLLKGGFYPSSEIHVESVQTTQSFDGPERAVTSGFFDTAGIRVLAGRDFVAADADNANRVAIVSEGFARRYIGGNPVGKRFSTRNDSGGHPVWMEIVGEVNDTRDRAVTELMRNGPTYYTPLKFGSRWLLIGRTSVDPASMALGIERVVWSVDKEALITSIQTVDEMVSNSAAPARFDTILLGLFGALGLLLAAVGVYGVLSYSTLERTREIGIRIALGARASDVVRLVGRQGVAPSLVGILCGVVGAMGLTRFLRNLLFEVQPTNPMAFSGVAVLLFVVALAACGIPARRAMRVDPTVALRHE